MYNNNKAQYQSLVRNEVKRLNDQINYQDLEASNASNDDDLHEPTNISLTSKLQTWYQKHRPSEACTNELLQILNDEGLDVPSSANQLANNAKIAEQIVMSIYAGDFQNNAINERNRNAEDHNIKKEHCKESNSIIKELQEQQRHMNAKLNHMTREIAKVNVRLNISSGVETEVQKTSTIFPIENVTDLADFENSLDDLNTATHVLAVKRIVNSDHINKSLLRLLSKDILLEHNLDGRQKKLPLNVYPKLLNMLFRAYDNYESFSEFTWDLKHAMKRIKNRFHKANCINRKITLTPSADPLSINAKHSKKVKHDDDDDCFF